MLKQPHARDVLQELESAIRVDFYNSWRHFSSTNEIYGGIIGQKNAAKAVYEQLENPKESDQQEGHLKEAGLTEDKKKEMLNTITDHLYQAFKKIHSTQVLSLIAQSGMVMMIEKLMDTVKELQFELKDAHKDVALDKVSREARDELIKKNSELEKTGAEFSRKITKLETEKEYIAMALDRKSSEFRELVKRHDRLAQRQETLVNYVSMLVASIRLQTAGKHEAVGTLLVELSNDPNIKDMMDPLKVQRLLPLESSKDPREEMHSRKGKMKR